LPSVYKNIAANYLGNIITAALAFLFVPVYVRYLGISTYGIIGFFATVQVLFSFLDMGIGMAINREMARHYHNSSMAGYLRKLSHTLQLVYWAIGLMIGIVLLIGSPYLSANWFKETTVPRNTVYLAFIILSLTIGFRWPYGLYSSGLRGMQHQVALNIHDLFWGLTKTIGSWIVLKYFDNTLQSFLWFQCAITILQTFGVMLMLWYYMPRNVEKNELVFDKSILKNISRYAAGMGIAAILGTVVLQMDKIIVSKMVSDKQFGYYTIATNVSILVYNVSFPLYMAILPHFTKLFFEHNLTKVKEDFHFYARMLSSLLLPFSIVIFFYSKEFLWLWTKNTELAETISPILKLMIAGTTLNAMIMPVHTLLLANNRVRFMLYSHVAACVIALPVIILLTLKLGVKGGAVSVLLLFAGYVCVQAPLIFRNLNLKGSLIRWYTGDILFLAIPLIALSLVFEQLKKYIITTDRWHLFANLAGITIIYYCISLLMNKQLLRFLLSRIKVLAAKQTAG
jgi:O-antigen/teichoic acid export membrane protein